MLAGLGASAALAVVERQGAALRERFAGRRDVAADMDRFRERAPQLADVDALLRDRRALTVVLEAFQLESEIDKRALLRRVMTEDPSASGSLAQRLSDPRWRQMAQAFSGRSGPPLADPALIERLVARAVTNRFEKTMGDANPGLREALYFRRVAPELRSVPQLMADRALTEVARGALGLPREFALLSFEQQRDTLTRRLDIGQLQDPRFAARLVQRYLAGLERAAPATPALQLLGGNGPAIAEIAALRLSVSA
ncbi:DUF1217 domain-containing protein [Falsiroseomonas oryziterrae]|uniref:DUF1217 domain-containing protein n=1 Tax=Falsiroseomonas oryziterrae TaxID=2911368 RepID=UPI001F318AE9|nr:DUF1217 domain-containing protein [Roseomonas sp. NPKOSM-4]